MPITVESILSLYAERAVLPYDGEQVSHLEHALQAAQLARLEGASAELAAAAFLHDIGHLVARRTHALEVDDLHEYTGIAFLRGAFGVAVLEPIKLHVEAGRYLCGGLSADESRAFLLQPYAADAVRLRRWDDAAKVPSLAVPELGSMAALLRAAGDCHKTAIASL